MNVYDLGVLEFGQTYVWRVDEVNDLASPSVWQGKIWSFTTISRVVVADFEGYLNSSPYRVFQTWIDGMGFSSDEFFPIGNSGNGTGAVVGYDHTTGPIMEHRIVYGGMQSMPFMYDGLSEATPRFGPSSNRVGQLYVKINGQKVLYDGDASDLAADQWKRWSIELPESAGLKVVKTLTIGVSGGKGILYIDEIGLYANP